jgi:hypothetical protein
MDLSVPVLSDPERTFGPREARVTATARRRNGGEHAASLGIDLMDVILGDLIEMLSIEGRSRMRRDIDRAMHLAAQGIEGIQLVSGSEPNVLTIVGDAMDSLRTLERAVLANDFGF